LSSYTFPTTVRTDRVDAGGIAEGPVWTLELADPEVAPVLDIATEINMIPKFNESG
jgi:hypothetical protein